jgi:hypothetical protein
MKCWKCSEEIKPRERIEIHADCTRCGAALHCCRNCRFYDPEYHNQCREPMAERVVDKERFNFCEYFAPATDFRGAERSVAKSDARAKLEALFRRKS